MKINKLFHWLYFFVMALPIVVAPIFALYTTNKNASFDNTIQVEETKVVNFNQLISSVNSGSPIYSFNDGLVTIIGESDVMQYATSNPISLIQDNKYLVKGLTGSTWSTPITTYFDTLSGNITVTETIFTATSNGNGYFNIRVQPNEEVEASFYPQVFNLTKMFGSGNEPSIEQFNVWFSNVYYSYNNGTEQLLHTGIYDTLSDTDVGSQFIYSMYNCVDKYFNYDRVFNFGDLYTWLNTTFFTGQAPLGFFIFWHLLIYWLLTSILWLVFDVLIYVPMLVHRWLDKASLS